MVRRSIAVIAMLALMASAPSHWSAEAVKSAGADDTPIFVTRQHRPNQDAWRALEALASAASDGLAPELYGADVLMHEARALNEHVLPATMALEFDRRLTTAVLVYARDLSSGRVSVSDRRGARAGALLSRDSLRAIVEAGRLSEAIRSWAPRDEPYLQLRAALARYRGMAAESKIVNLPSSAGVVHPGDSDLRIPSVARRLVAFGDLDSPVPEVTEAYTGALVAAVKRFQRRHLLDADGVIGAGTFAALDVPMPVRIGQLELAMERWRALPDLGQGDVIFVNAATARLWAWDVSAEPWMPMTMNAVVGRARVSETPELAADLTTIELSPFWNVPTSIARREILPRAILDPDYLQTEGMEIVHGPGDDATRMPITPQTLADVRSGVSRLRQKPGPKNAMGQVKLVFPNAAGVFIHGTSAPSLFAQPRRDRSHGCIRVERPIALAAWALARPDEWPEKRLAELAAAGRPLRLSVSQAVKVVLSDATAAADPEMGLVFAPDRYGRDERLVRMLDAIAVERTSQWVEEP